MIVQAVTGHSANGRFAVRATQAWSFESKMRIR